MSISKVLIANRGEIAVRIIEACRELDLQTVAIYSEPDRYQPHVGLAGESYCIGPGDPEESYLNFPAVMSAADISGADAIHPGYGFLAENSHFAEVCEDHGMRFIGPTSKVLQKAGDKLESKKMAKKAGAQILSGSLKPISSEQELRSQADDLGYPLIVKAALGGGGRGMRVVEGEEELLNAFKTSKQEAQKAFGNDDIYLESFLEEPKHIEVQVIADTQGNITDIGERDCSIQRRHQKLIEEAPAPHLPEEVRREIRATAVAIAEEFGYRSLGTVEFLVDGELDFYFIELNARLQVEHPVSEEIFGCNMIKDQL
ncbi:MAG: biotin carboxylase N-terminal domain-containing protein, partial [Candidatus Bipolaricaulota bacterium]